MGKKSLKEQVKASQKYVERNREKSRRRRRKYYRENRIKEILRCAKKNKTIKGKSCAKLRHAIRSGKMVKPKLCPRCEREAILHGHHKDYSRPFKVKWLCSICHGRVHRKYK